MSFAVAAVGVGASVVGSMIASDGASDAANIQAGASQQAAELQRQTAQEQIALQREQYQRQEALVREQMARDRQVYDQAIARQEPFRQAGLRGLTGYEQQINQGFHYDPNAFSLDRIMNDPGVAFRREQGNRQIQRTLNAGPTGTYSGAAAQALLDYNSGLASQEYGAAYGRAADAEARRKDEYQLRSNQLASMAGIGQTANNASQVAGQGYSWSGQNSTNALGQAGSNMTNNSSNALANMANGVGSNMIGAANAQAGASMYQGNTWANAFNQGASAIGNAFRQNQAQNQANFYAQPYEWQSAF